MRYQKLARLNAVLRVLVQQQQQHLIPKQVGSVEQPESRCIFEWP